MGGVQAVIPTFRVSVEVSGMAAVPTSKLHVSPI